MTIDYGSYDVLAARQIVAEDEHVREEMPVSSGGKRIAASLTR
ncbi:hypothetical protein [Tunturibacter empetritectus]|uniref:Uncharacterized protein n=1 Tax=Tunturiibacter lichenicola TaxID=2051959 RepID=A0A7W8J7S2_9BACT|nr:hypothetical protein [Edaphobacter lichenicola]MBB5342899.1 hypothetical protein [Edaphobacter lichenicola]